MPTNNEERGRTLYEDGRLMMDNKRFDEAVVLFKDALSSVIHFKTLELLGEALIELGKYDEAIVPLAAASTLNPSLRSSSLLCLALVNSERRMMRQFAPTFVETVLAQDPRNKKALEAKRALLVPRNE
jgi:tetratricopeptide (TPR) repeat protein